MKRNIFWIIAAVVIIVPVFIFMQARQIRAVRTYIVADYLEMAKVLSSFMIETSISTKVSQPSEYSRQVLEQENRDFQKKYRRYKNLRLYQHNRVGDFLASVDATVKNYAFLAQVEKRENPKAWQQKVLGLQKLCFHNAVYCALAVGKDKANLAISLRQRNFLLANIYSTYGAILFEYAKWEEKPSFLATIILIKDSLESRRAIDSKRVLANAKSRK